MIVWSLLLAANAPAQFTAVGYNFSSTQDAVPDNSWTWSQNVDLDGVAANGFGVWTASALSSGSSQNFLLGNKLRAGTNAAQSGEIAYRAFTYGDPPDGTSGAEVMKIATNLKGYVRYVYFKPKTSTPDEIWVEGYDPSPTSPINLTVGVNARFEGLPGAGASDVVKDISPNDNQKRILPTGHHLSTVGDPHEHFDIAMDASYLYIVWEEVVGGFNTVWAAAVQIDHPTVYALSPTQISPASENAVLPTVSVNVRASGSVRFDAAWLTATSSGSVKWCQYYSGTLHGALLLPTSYNKPGGGTGTWSNPQHARVLVASAASYGTSTLEQKDRGVYIIADAGGMNLFFADIVNQVIPPNCDYADGNLNTGACDPVIARTPGFNVVNHYIEAFVNPYDGDGSAPGAFNEYHCLYQLDYQGTGVITAHTPLMIVPKANYTDRFCVSGDQTAHVFFNDPDVYGGAANQMGIHTLYRNNGTTTLYYRRDSRFLDENIEENTLATDNVVVADGTTHGGSLTPTLLGNLCLAVYSDPVGVSNSFPSYTGQGLLEIRRGATSADVLKLNIGDASNTGARIVVVGRGAIKFTGATTDANISELVVAADNFMDWNATSSGNSSTGIFGAGTSVFSGSGHTLSSNRASGQYVSAITDPATLTVGPGASLNFDMSTDNFTNLTMTDAVVSYPFDHPVTASTSDTTHTVGQVVLRGESIITRIQFLSQDEWYDPTVLNMRGGFSGQLAPVTFTDCYFRAYFNSDPAVNSITGHAKVLSNTTDHHPQASAPAWTIAGGKAEGFSFGDDNTIQGGAVSITNFDMDNIQEFAISVDYPSTSTTYSGTFTNNYFYDFNVSRHSSPTGILIAGATDDLDLTKLDIESNTFVQGSGTPSSAAVAAAIHLTNCAALVGYNNVSGAKFAKGIWVENGGSSTTRHSLICSNAITGLTSGTGLVTNSYDGYAKLNSSTGNLTGHSSGANDVGHVIFSTYTGNSSYGFEGIAATTAVDMAGVHHPTDPTADLAAFNVIKDNGYPQISLGSGAAVFVGNADQSGNQTWTVYGENRIERGTQTNTLLMASSTSVNIFNIDANYWGGGSPASDITGITYSLTSYETTVPTIPTVSCSGGLIAHHKGTDHISTLPVIEDAWCHYLWSQGSAYDGVGSYQKSRDTLRLYVETCYDRHDNVWLGIFEKLGGAESGVGSQNHDEWPNFREWLKKVLYYNTDSDYYCGDLNEIWGTFQANNSDSLTEYRALTDRLAVLRYIIESGKCPALAHDYASIDPAYGMSIWDLQLQNRRKLWEDSLKSWGIDPSTRTMDSTLPNIDDLGLSLLRGKPSSVSGATQHIGPSLVSVSALNNPFNRDLDLTVDMGREALVTVEMFDLLGNAVPLTGMKYMLKESGPQRVTVPVGSLAAGTYYLRVSTDWGDVKTVKVVKE